MLFAVTIFLSAFLLFQVQPLIGKYILPWFGGTPGVWTTCLLFFQVFLLAGYAYAHLIVSRLSSRKQGQLHLALLAVALLTLPIAPAESWKPVGDENPLWRILGLLGASVGVPYLLLSSTGPLLQGWFSRVHRGRSPYRLYALSNVGSLLALLTYPLVFERVLRLRTQAVLWSCGWALFAVLCAALAIRLIRENPPPPESAPVDQTGPAGTVSQRPTVLVVLLWLCLAACGSVMLLATTNQICQDVAVVPFLWVLPLSLYLLSFIICFDKDEWYHRTGWATLLVVAIALACYALDKGVHLSIWRQIAAFSLAMFACCMVCHGELVRLKPDPRHLTLFYLMVSLGGAIGGILVAIVAPRAFTGFWELQGGLVATCGLMLTVAGREWLVRRRRGEFVERPAASQLVGALTGAVAALGTVLLAYFLVTGIQDSQRLELRSVRNFYGVLRVLDEKRDEPDQHRLVMCHGRTRHGFQFVAPAKRAWPTSYFGPKSGIALAINRHPARATRPLRVGVIGLGTGTIAVHTQPGDDLVYYEINPMVKALDDEFFTYLPDAARRGVRTDLLLGDARIVLERKAARGEIEPYDVLAADAFNSDAIPMHLLTREAYELYWQWLQPDGILAMQATNRYVDITRVVRGLAALNQKTAVDFPVPGDPVIGTSRTRWVLVTSNPTFLSDPRIQSGSTPWPPTAPTPILWTDDFSNLYDVLAH